MSRLMFACGTRQKAAIVYHDAESREIRSNCWGDQNDGLKPLKTKMVELGAQNIDINMGCPPKKYAIKPPLCACLR